MRQICGLIRFPVAAVRKVSNRTGHHGPPRLIKVPPMQIQANNEAHWVSTCVLADQVTAARQRPL